MTVLALIGIKEALNIIALRVSLMIDYSFLTDRQINHIKVWTHTTRLPQNSANSVSGIILKPQNIIYILMFAVQI
jgi:hypothetical protein